MPTTVSLKFIHLQKVMKLARALVNEIPHQNDYESITIKSSFYGQAAYEYEQVCESNNTLD